jgi:hypothetical protein
MEYAEKYYELKKFARLYTALRYNRTPGIKNNPQKTELRTMYHFLKKDSRKPGFLNRIKSFFTLRGLYY